jgi:4'-phosphopantetheinyl transferase
MSGCDGLRTGYLVRSAAEVPPDDLWLDASEACRLASLAVPKRRLDWRLGRWTAKQALAAVLGVQPAAAALAALQIHAAADGAPEAYVAGRPAAWNVSITHRDRMAACALAPSGTQIGCDLEAIEDHSAAFVADHCSASEQALLSRCTAATRPAYVSLIWSAKESALKALRTGLRASPAAYTVRLRQALPRDGWRPLHVEAPDGAVLYGWWRRDALRVLTLVTIPAGEPPLELRIKN